MNTINQEIDIFKYRVKNKATEEDKNLIKAIREANRTAEWIDFNNQRLKKVDKEGV